MSEKSQSAPYCPQSKVRWSGLKGGGGLLTGFLPPDWVMQSVGMDGCAKPQAIEIRTQTFHRRGMIFVLAYPEFETRVAERIARFRAANEPERAKLVPPHVTLVFGLRTVKVPEFLSLCDSVAKGASEFVTDFPTHEITHDPFENAHKLLLLSAVGGRRLVDLHERLYDGPQRAELHPDHPFRPHMTVATHRERSVLEQLDISELGALPITGAIRSLEIVDLVDQQLRRLRTIPLQKRMSPQN